MIIEMLYPELSNLYGDAANINYIKESCTDIKVIETHLGDSPLFLDEGKVDLVYRGTMTERGQELFIENLSKYIDELKNAIERGQHFLVTGNAVEVFGNYIIDKTGEKIDCLEVFEFHTERDILAKRFNSLYVGIFNEIKIVGFKSQFGHSFYEGEITPLFETLRGPGFNKNEHREGIHYKNFIGTYLLGPLLVLNPDFATCFMNQFGIADFKPAYYETAKAAYDLRLKQYLDEKTGFYY